MFAPVTVAATSGVGPERGRLASGLLNTTRQIGGALGLAVLGAVAAHSAGRSAGEGAGHAEAMSAGYATAFTVGAVIFLATAVIGSLVLPARLGATGRGSTS